ncbi:ATP-binding protein [Magnetofaba australis]|uniref:Sensory/regulatory protein RpfC n=1 Tax=Magnetofaba australis IT-1 TaxID=1434232 RepID=A0A1Y2KA78_9PROT|nr:ATP-binding protein [Magnetofaba australis]OSM06824.1 putative PAS/PAC sensor hybrid histidine kinase [Magnetofaba australis IT-1]
MSISGKIITLVTFIALLSAGSVGYSILRNFHDEQTRQAGLEARHAASESAAALRWRIDQLLSDVRRLAQDPALEELAELARGVDRGHGDARYQQRRLLEIFRALASERADYLSVQLIGVDDAGRELARIYRPERGGDLRPAAAVELAQLGESEAFKRAIILPEGRIYLSDVRLMREGPEVVEPHLPMLTAAAPAFNRRGEVFGVVRITLDMRGAFEHLRSLQLGVGMHLFNEQGYLLALGERHGNEPTFGFEFNLPTQMLNFYPPLERHLQYGGSEPFSLLVRNGQDGGEEMIGVAPLRHNPARPDKRLILVISAPYAKLMDRLNASRDESLLLGLSAMVVALVLGGLMTRSLTRPLREMIDSVQSMQNGCARKPLPVKASGEVGILARAFDEMLRKLREQSRNDADARAKELLDATNVGVFGINGEGLVSFVNPAAERMLGFTANELLGQNVHQLIHHSHADGSAYPETACRMSAALREQREHHVSDEVLWRKNGEFFHAEYSSIPLSGAERHGAVVTFWDTSRKHLDEQRLIESQQAAEQSAAEERAMELLLKITLQESATLDYLSEALQTMIFSVPWLKLKPVGAIFLSERHEGELGLKLVAEHNLDDHLKLQCARVPFGQCLCGRAAQSGTLQFADCIDARHDIHYAQMEEHGHYNVPILEGERVLGVVVLYLTVGHQQKEHEAAFLVRAANVLSMGLVRRRAAKELGEAIQKARKANNAKSEFLATMSHEIRNPMNAIIGLSHLALGQSEDNRQRDYLDKIHNAGQSLLRIINDILDFSKIEAGKLDIETTDFQLDDVLANLATFTAVKAQEKRVELIFDKPADLPNQLRGDPLRLNQVLLNLTGNAIKFTEEGEVELAVSCVAQDATHVELRFDVRDSGIGMTEEQLQNLFTAYSQAEASTSRRFGGSGLGLAISHQLVTLMSGNIEVSSTPGQGSVFSFTLPFEVAAPNERSWRPCEEKALPDEPVGVAIAHPRVADVVEANLQRFGFRTERLKSLTALTQWLDRRAGAEPPFVALDADMLPVTMAQDLALVLEPLQERLLNGGVLMLHGYQTQQAVMDLAEENLRIAAAPKPATPSALFDAVITLLKGQAPTRSDARGAQSTQTHWPALSGKRVLLAEDNAVNQQVGLELLRAVGVAADVASNGHEAVQKAIAGGYDAILMDLQMPVMDGLQAAERIRHEVGEQPPIIAMTASSLETDRHKSIEAGMNDHIGKPIDPGALYAQLDRWIGAGAESPAGDPPSSAAAAKPTPTPATPAPEAPAVGPIPAVEASARFAQLPGVNAQVGLARMNGNAELYVNVLKSFLQDQRDVCARMTQAAQAGAHSKLERIAHTLKGLLGSIGAEALQTQALALEKGAEKQVESVALTQQIDALTAPLQTLFTAVAQLTGDGATEPATAPLWSEADAEKLAMHLTALREGLEKRRPAACREPLAALKEWSYPEEVAAEMAELIALAGKYRFKQALDALDALEAKRA